jgi:ABC-2 type transport system permease protein
MARGLLIGISVYAISQLFGFYAIHHIPLVIGLSLLSTMAFALLGLLNALFATKFDDISLIPTFLLTPLIYLGGIFYSLSQVRGWLHTVTLYNPLYYLIAAYREAMIGPQLTLPISAIVFSLCFLNGALLLGNWYLLSRRIGMGSN